MPTYEVNVDLTTSRQARRDALQVALNLLAHCQTYDWDLTGVAVVGNKLQFTIVDPIGAGQESHIGVVLV
jgi:hypothetical protein